MADMHADIHALEERAGIPHDPPFKDLGKARRRLRELWVKVGWLKKVSPAP